MKAWLYPQLIKPEEDVSMSRDRQQFRAIPLSNGITVYHYPTEELYAATRIRVPIGHVHSHRGNGVRGGFAHFLEHATLKRSARFPEYQSFWTYVGLRGGHINATTSSFYTTFHGMAPSESFEESWEGLASHAFEPVFDAEDVARERGIVWNERQLQERYFPAQSETSQFLSARWQRLCPFTLRQVIGDRDDLRSITPDTLAAFHQNYLDPRVVVLLVGGVPDPARLLRRLELLEVRPRDMEERYARIEWADREIREFASPDTSSPGYLLSGFSSAALDHATHVAIGFIGDFLTNPYHGPLIQWLRYEKGWTYGVQFDMWDVEPGCVWLFDVPLQTRRQIARVRADLLKRMHAGLQDPEALSREVERRLSARVFSLQTAEAICTAADESLNTYGRIVTEREWRADILRCRDVDYVTGVFNQFIANPDHTGGIALIPA